MEEQKVTNYTCITSLAILTLQNLILLTDGINFGFRIGLSDLQC